MNQGTDATAGRALSDPLSELFLANDPHLHILGFRAQRRLV